MNHITIAKADRFHVYRDTELAFEPSRVVETNETKYFIIQEREVSYRFYLHQHPYVQQLVQRLLRKGTSGLQAADTEYSTRVKLTNATAAKDANGRSVQLAVGSILHLSDGATVTLDGGVIRFVGSKVLKLLDESPIAPAANTPVTLPGQAAGRRSSGDLVTLDAAAAAALVDGVPLPVLYADIFTPTRYNPSALVQRPYPVKDLDFTSGGAYSAYNWELFFHVPITIAIHLTRRDSPTRSSKR